MKRSCSVCGKTYYSPTAQTCPQCKTLARQQRLKSRMSFYSWCATLDDPFAKQILQDPVWPRDATAVQSLRAYLDPVYHDEINDLWLRYRQDIWADLLAPPVCQRCGGAKKSRNGTLCKPCSTVTNPNRWTPDAASAAAHRRHDKDRRDRVLADQMREIIKERGGDPDEVVRSWQ